MQILDIRVNKDQKETTQHGTVSFPVAVYHSVMARNVLGFVNWHWHEELQFCVVLRGELVFYVNENQYRLKVGQGLFINSGSLHMVKPVKDSESTYLCIDIHPRLLSSFPGSIIETRYMAPYLKEGKLSDLQLDPEVQWQQEILEKLYLVDKLYEQKEYGYELDICSIMMQVWKVILIHISQKKEKLPAGNQSRNTAVQDILSYISQHYGEPVTLDMIAKELSFSTSECCRMFKKVTGETIFSYLLTYRIVKATEMLHETDLSISEIAYETGFGSTSYFIEKFKEKTGTTPLKYRKKIQ